MASDGVVARLPAGRVPAALQRLLRQLPMGAPERQAIEAGEIDAVIDHRSANVIVFPAAKRALRVRARHLPQAGCAAAADCAAQNSLLGGLPGAELRRLLPALEPVRLEPGDTLHEAGAPIRYVYFPIDCVICLLTRIDDRRTVATGLVGHDGMVGMPLALEVGVSSVHAVVQVPGTALRMPAAQFSNEFQRGLQLQRQLYRHAQAKLNLARQTAACAGSHSLEQRLACWLLMIGDRTRTPDLPLTQEHLAACFNVRRVSVTIVSGVLRSRGLISYHRGRISILDRPGLERTSCGCYRPLVVDAPD